MASRKKKVEEQPISEATCDIVDALEWAMQATLKKSQASAMPYQTHAAVFQGNIAQW